jgi:nitroreductase
MLAVLASDAVGAPSGTRAEGGAMYQLLARTGNLRRIVEAATAAPSIHNTQPWRFAVTADDMLEVHADPSRALWVADPRGRALYLSCGAALFNIRATIRMAGFNPMVWPLPRRDTEPDLVAIVRAEPGRPASLAEREMYEAIWRRHTDRSPFTEAPVPGPVQVALEQAARFEFTSLRALSRTETGAALDLAASASAALATHVDHQIELGRWIATASPVDGIPAAALPPQARREPAPVRGGDFAAAAPTVSRGAGDYERSPALSLLSTTRDEPADWIRAGQALQRVLLLATVHGLSASFLYQPIELADIRAASTHPASGPHSWPWPENPQMLIRFGYGSGGAAATPRRPVEDVIRT